jgi:starvation-inducible DNA-binding protein
LKINIGITENNRKNVIHLLNILLSDEYVLYTKTLNYHWNITGNNFAELHKFLEEQYQDLQEIADSVAERTRKLDGHSFGTISEFSKNSRLKEFPGQRLKAAQMIKNLVDDHESVIVLLRKDLNLCDEKYSDKGTCDFLTGLMEQHEKMAWMLRSYLE